MDRNVQLLAHARAPSNRKDDDRYRSQLHAYINLHPAQVSRAALWPNIAPAVEEDIPDSNDRTSDQASIDPTLYLEDTQLAYTALQSQLYTSAPAVARPGISISRNTKSLSARPASASKPMRGSVGAASVTSDAFSQTRGESPVTSQSSYLASPFVARPSKRQRLRGEEAGIPNVGAYGHRTSETRHSVGGVHAPTSTRKTDNEGSEEGTITTDDATSELPTSYSLSEAQSDSAEQRPASARRSSASEWKDKSSSKSTQQAFDFMKSKASRPVDRDFATLSKDSAIKKRCDKSERISPPSASTIASLQSLATEIDPPEPELGYGQFRTHVTKVLQRLGLNQELVKVYDPISVKRELVPLERGYWWVDCSIWPLQKQVDFWKYLETLIRSGRVGWGVRCTRGTAHTAVNPSGASNVDPSSCANNIVTSGSSPAYTFGPIKIYCWGELVRHIYLLLYVASGSKVRKLGLQWVDARGEVVVQMRKAGT